MRQRRIEHGAAEGAPLPVARDTIGPLEVLRRGVLSSSGSDGGGAAASWGSLIHKRGCRSAPIRSSVDESASRRRAPAATKSPLVRAWASRHSERARLWRSPLAIARVPQVLAVAPWVHAPPSPPDATTATAMTAAAAGGGIGKGKGGGGGGYDASAVEEIYEWGRGAAKPIGSAPLEAAPRDARPWDPQRPASDAGAREPVDDFGWGVGLEHRADLKYDPYRPQPVAPRKAAAASHERDTLNDVESRGERDVASLQAWQNALPRSAAELDAQRTQDPTRTAAGDHFQWGTADDVASRGLDHRNEQVYSDAAAPPTKETMEARDLRCRRSPKSTTAAPRPNGPATAATTQRDPSWLVRTVV